MSIHTNIFYYSYTIGLFSPVLGTICLILSLLTILVPWIHLWLDFLERIVPLLSPILIPTVYLMPTDIADILMKILQRSLFDL